MTCHFLALFSVAGKNTQPNDGAGAISPRMANRSTPTHEEISRRAHEIFERHGSVHGRAMDHWLEAEAELMGEGEASKASPKQDAQPRQQQPQAKKESPAPKQPQPQQQELKVDTAAPKQAKAKTASAAPAETTASQSVKKSTGKGPRTKR